MTDEKRRVARIPWLRFIAEVKVRRSFFRSEWIEIYIHDFTRLGMGIQTDEVFNQGETIYLNLALEMEAGVTRLESVPAVVMHKEKHHSRFNYGLSFELTTKGIHKQPLKEELERIETVLIKHAKLKERFAKGTPGDTP